MVIIMEQMPISRDDVMDVMEMTEKLETFITETLQGNQKTLALSALMSATINCALTQCDTLDDVMLYRNVFVKALDDAILCIQINPKSLD